MSNNKSFTFIDLFAGCGGLSEGFLQTGKFEGLAHVEWESPMVNTLRQRLVDKWGHSEQDAKDATSKFLGHNKNRNAVVDAYIKAK